MGGNEGGLHFDSPLFLCHDLIVGATGRQIHVDSV